MLATSTEGLNELGATDPGRNLPIVQSRMQWRFSSALGLESVIQREPKLRSSGTIMIRVLICLCCVDPRDHSHRMHRFAAGVGNLSMCSKEASSHKS